MGRYRSLFVLMDSNGYLLVFMDFMGPSAFLWILMCLGGCVWVLVGSFVCL